MTTTSKIQALLPKPGPAMIVDTLKLVMSSANEWVAVTSQERSRRQAIESWEMSQIAIIDLQRDFLLSALEKTFDERSENFRRLFDQLDEALRSDREDSAVTVSDLLSAITELAAVSPFKDLKSPALVVQEFLQTGRTIEL